MSITDIFYTIVRLLDIEGAAAPTGAPASYLLCPGIKEKSCYSELKVDRVGERAGADKNDIRALWTAKDRHYILSENVSYECYDLVADPDETHNLCPSKLEKSELVSALTGFESKIELFIESLEDLRSSRPSRIDPQHEAALRALGYVRGSTAGKDTEKLSWHGREHFNTGVFHLGRREYGPAREEFNNTLIIDPDYRPAHVALGQLLFREKRYNEALEHFLKISSKFPGDPEIQRLTTVLYALNGEPEQAEQLFLHLVEIYPEMAPKFFSQQGNMFLRRREPEPALILFDLLRNRFPKVADYERGYREAYQRLRDKSQ